ncbi:MAG TPA: ABC transporter ATP-binding protein [Kiritimatiellia bacterium]|nr:ABC transporter ATP-binding protein [Kiritimatiellia bacterium]
MDTVVIQNVSKCFGRTQAVKNLSLSVRPGEILGFLGTNGAGKTTTIKMMLGLLAPDAGSIHVLGGDPRDASARSRTGYMPETATFYPYLNLHELLFFYGGLCGMSRLAIRARARVLIERMGLGEAAGRLLRTYSKGMLQRAGIIQAVLHDPDLLILDEPLTGLDPLVRIQFRDFIRELREQGKTIFFSSHELTEAELICDRVAILKQGELVVCGEMQAIAGDGGQNLERIFLNVLGADAEKGVPA